MDEMDSLKPRRSALRLHAKTDGNLRATFRVTEHGDLTFGPRVVMAGQAAYDAQLMTSDHVAFSAIVQNASDEVCHAIQR